MLIDTHTHINDPVYRGGDKIVESMGEDGLEALVVVGSNEYTSVSALKLAEKYKGVWAAVGVHPSDSANVQAGYISLLADLAESEKCVAIGEIGLDYHYDDTDRIMQKQVLVDQLRLARRAMLPVIFHVRDAFGDFNEIIDEHGDNIVKGAVMHCYSGSAELAERYVKRGFYISFSGSITFKSNHKAADVIRAVPRERILIETDCPYLTPEPHRGTTNVPAYVKYQAQKIAEVLGETPEDVAAFTRENAYRLFTRMREGK